jgi:hypothetical protein
MNVSRLVPVLMLAVACGPQTPPSSRSSSALRSQGHSSSVNERQVELQPGAFALNASGEVAFVVRDGVLSGQIEAEDLPAQGAHAFYVFWFVRTDTGDKAFLGPVVHEDSILFLTGGGAEMMFKASAFTDGPHKGSAISLGSPGNNFFVLIAENKIDTFMPFPVSAPPNSFALTSTF